MVTGTTGNTHQNWAITSFRPNSSFGQFPFRPGCFCSLTRRASQTKNRKAIAKPRPLPSDEREPRISEDKRKLAVQSKVMSLVAADVRRLILIRTKKLRASSRRLLRCMKPQLPFASPRSSRLCVKIPPDRGRRPGLARRIWARHRPRPRPRRRNPGAGTDPLRPRQRSVQPNLGGDRTDVENCATSDAYPSARKMNDFQNTSRNPFGIHFCFLLSQFLFFPVRPHAENRPPRMPTHRLSLPLSGCD